MVQRKMLRKIVGWIRVKDEPWDTTMRRMKVRVMRGLHQRQVVPWSTRIASSLWKMILRIKEAANECWIHTTSMWEINVVDDPYSEFIPYRNPGRVCRKWDSVVNEFCYLTRNESWQNLSIDVLSNCTDAFTEYCSTEWAKSLPKRAFNLSRNVVQHNAAHVPFFEPSSDNWR